MQKPLYTPEQLKEDKLFVLKKLNLDEEEFEKLLTAPLFCDYESNYKLLTFLIAIKRKLSWLIK
jgi:hypothetical protein